MDRLFGQRDALSRRSASTSARHKRQAPAKETIAPNDGDPVQRPASAAPQGRSAYRRSLAALASLRHHDDEPESAPQVTDRSLDVPPSSSPGASAVTPKAPPATTQSTTSKERTVTSGSLASLSHLEALTQSWRMKERIKTAAAAMLICLNIGVDPPDVVKQEHCATTQCWTDPFAGTPAKAMEQIARNLQSQYEVWQPRARYKVSMDPSAEEAKKVCCAARRNAKEDRVLFHYNGHGVPKPTTNGELWVFNKTYTQYIPLSIFDIQEWIGTPSIYVFDCSRAGNLMVEASDSSGAIYLAACAADEELTLHPGLPADVFTACLTTPIETGLQWILKASPMMQFGQLNSASHGGLQPEDVFKLPGRINDRRSPLGELHWVFTAITDTIAWDILPAQSFRQLFRQDLLVAALFRNYLFACRIMHSQGLHPQSVPALPPTIWTHELWDSWDLALDTCLTQLAGLIGGRIVAAAEEELTNRYLSYAFFEAQLTAFAFALDRRAAEEKELPHSPSIFTSFPLARSTPLFAASSQHTLSMQPSQSTSSLPVRSSITSPTVSTSSLSTVNASLHEHHSVQLSPSILSMHPPAREAPLQLPILLQVLLSQAHRERALVLLARYISLSAEAVQLVLHVGVFPYICKLLLSTATELRPLLCFLWARILCFEETVLNELCMSIGTSSSSSTSTASTSKEASLSPPPTKSFSSSSLSVPSNDVKEAGWQFFLKQLCQTSTDSALLQSDKRMQFERGNCLFILYHIAASREHTLQTMLQGGLLKQLIFSLAHEPSDVAICWSVAFLSLLWRLDGVTEKLIDANVVQRLIELTRQRSAIVRSTVVWTLCALLQSQEDRRHVIPERQVGLIRAFRLKLALEMCRIANDGNTNVRFQILRSLTVFLSGLSVFSPLRADPDAEEELDDVRLFDMVARSINLRLQRSGARSTKDALTVPAIQPTEGPSSAVLAAAKENRLSRLAVWINFTSSSTTPLSSGVASPAVAPTLVSAPPSPVKTMSGLPLPIASNKGPHHHHHQSEAAPASHFESTLIQDIVDPPLAVGEPGDSDGEEATVSKTPDPLMVYEYIWKTLIEFQNDPHVEVSRPASAIIDHINTELAEAQELATHATLQYVHQSKRSSLGSDVAQSLPTSTAAFGYAGAMTPMSILSSSPSSSKKRGTVSPLSSSASESERPQTPPVHLASLAVAIPRPPKQAAAGSSHSLSGISPAIHMPPGGTHRLSTASFASISSLSGLKTILTVAFEDVPDQVHRLQSLFRRRKWDHQFELPPETPTSVASRYQQEDALFVDEEGFPHLLLFEKHKALRTD